MASPRPGSPARGERPESQPRVWRCRAACPSHPQPDGPCGPRRARSGHLPPGAGSARRRAPLGEVGPGRPARLRGGSAQSRTPGRGLGAGRAGGDVRAGGAGDRGPRRLTPSRPRPRLSGPISVCEIDHRDHVAKARPIGTGSRGPRRLVAGRSWEPGGGSRAGPRGAALRRSPRTARGGGARGPRAEAGWARPAPSPASSRAARSGLGPGRPGRFSQPRRLFAVNRIEPFLAPEGVHGGGRPPGAPGPWGRETPGRGGGAVGEKRGLCSCCRCIPGCRAR